MKRAELTPLSGQEQAQIQGGDIITLIVQFIYGFDNACDVADDFMINGSFRPLGTQL